MSFIDQIKLNLHKLCNDPEILRIAYIGKLFGVIFCISTVFQTIPAIAQSSKTVNHDPLIVENPESLPNAEFSLKINDIVVPYSTFSVFVMPREVLDFEILYSQSEQGYKLTDITKEVSTLSKNRWKWRAGSKPGLSKLLFEALDGSEKMVINAFVKTPANHVDGGKLKHYHIGPYPDETEIKNKNMYVVPDGYIEVTKENQNTKLSPHFKLKEFISKQRSSYPKFVYLQETLLLKLEKIRQELIANDVPVSNMVVMSGYRTPFYNKAIGNVKFSRHVFGDAADIFIDNDGDYRMDDINNDGKHDKKDAAFMASIVESLTKRESYRGLIGGLGVYGPKPHRGAFIHVDTRGVKARWSQ